MLFVSSLLSVLSRSPFPVPVPVLPLSASTRRFPSPPNSPPVRRLPAAMPAEQNFVREIARRINWRTVEGLWTEAFKSYRYKPNAPAPAADTAPDPPAPFIMRDPQLVIGRHGSSMMVMGRDGEPTLLLYRSPTYSAPPPVFSSDRSPTPPSVDITGHASNFPSPPPHASHNLNPFDWRKGFYLGIVVLSVYLAWRCYRRWGNGGGDQGDGPQAEARFDSHGLVDAVQAPTVAAYEGGKYLIMRQRNLSNLAKITEVSGVEQMVKLGEALFGPYAWERFDLMVQRPRFPYGGMAENPRIVFLNPTVAPELSHSWVGDLTAQQTNEDPWLNEDFMTYAKRRIVEVVQGEEGSGWRGINRMMERSEFINMAGFDADDILLCHIKRQIGLPAFVEFLKKLISTYKFQSIEVAKFAEFLKSNVPGGDDLDMWVDGTGTPSDAWQPDSAANRKICTLAAEFKYGKIPSEDEVADWGGQEWELYLAKLCTDNEASQVSALDEQYKLSRSPYYKVQAALLRLASPTGFKCCFNGIDKCLKIVGRMKYLQLNRPEQIQ